MIYEDLKFEIEGDNADGVLKLLEKGASVKHLYDDGWQPIHHAAWNGSAKCIEVLLEFGANVEERARDGELETPLLMAAQMGETEAVRVLLSHGAQVGAESRSGSTALHEAAGGGHEAATTLLINHQAPLDHQAVEGDTPLHGAVICNQLQTAKLLIDAGASLTVVDRHGMTPGKCARRQTPDPNFRAEIKALLLAAEEKEMLARETAAAMKQADGERQRTARANRI